MPSPLNRGTGPRGGGRCSDFRACEGLFRMTVTCLRLATKYDARKNLQQYVLHVQPRSSHSRFSPSLTVPGPAPWTVKGSRIVHRSPTTAQHQHGFTFKGCGTVGRCTVPEKREMIGKRDGNGRHFGGGDPPPRCLFGSMYSTHRGKY